MPWFRVDDTLALHAKVVQAGNAAMGLWVRAGSWSSQQLTDGHVPAHIAQMLGSRTEIQKLITAGLWMTVDGGYRFHDWSDRQPSREQVERDRLAAAERQRRARDRASETRGRPTSRGDAEATVTELSPRESRRDAGVSHDEVQAPSRSPRPGPTQPEVPDGTSSARRSPRGSRLPDDWKPTKDLVDQMRTECPGLDLQAEHRKFVDYWRAKTGKDATKADWSATWRNWMRTALERGGAQLPAVQANGTSPWDRR